MNCEPEEEKRELEEEEEEEELALIDREAFYDLLMEQQEQM